MEHGDEESSTGIDFEASPEVIVNIQIEVE